MTIERMELERIKQAVASHLSAELPATDEQLLNYSRGLIISTLAEIDKAAADDMDPQEFVPGRRVLSLRQGTPEQRGTVVRTVSQYGEVHTVIVHWDGFSGEEAVSPRVLEVLR